MTTMTEEQIAEKCADIMWQSDHASQSLGMEITHIAAGVADIQMTITNNMLNGHGTCHGGYIFTLADSAFAFACNSFNRRTVAQHCSISFLRPAYAEDVLSAKARVRSLQGRNGLYDVAVSNQKGEVIAEFRGHSREISGQHFTP